MSHSWVDGEIIVQFKEKVDVQKFFNELGLPLEIIKNIGDRYYVVKVPIGTENIYSDFLRCFKCQDVEYAATNKVGEL